MIKQYRNP